jgi:hypothetical protein
VPRWLDSKITQWQLWYFRAFRMRSIPRPPDRWVDRMLAEQKAGKEQEKRQEQRREELKKQNEGLQDASKQEKVKQDEGRPDEEDRIPKDWLQEKLSLQQAEAANTLPEGGVLFGGQNERWERMKASLQSSDQIWSFYSPPVTWEHCAGRSGVAVVREGRVVDCLITMMN